MTTRIEDLAGLSPEVRADLVELLYGYGPADPIDGTPARIGALYKNMTSNAWFKNISAVNNSALWNEQTVALSELSLAEGSIMVGNSSGVGAAVVAKTDKGVLIGDGTTTALRQISGDVTVGNTGVVAIGAAKVTEAMVALAALTGTVAKVVATENVIGGLLEVFWFSIDGGANDTQTITLTHKTKIIDFLVRLDGAGTTGGLVTLDNAGTAISNAIDISSGGDEDVFRPAEMDNAAVDVAAAAALGVITASTGGDTPAMQVMVIGMRVA